MIAIPPQLRNSLYKISVRLVKTLKVQPLIKWITAVLQGMFARFFFLKRNNLSDIEYYSDRKMAILLYRNIEIRQSDGKYPIRNFIS